MRKLSLHITQSSFNYLLPEMDDIEKQACNHAWFQMVKHERMGKKRILRNSSKAFDVPQSVIDKGIRAALGNDIWKVRNRQTEKKLIDSLYN